MDRSIVTGQSGRREDLQRDTVALVKGFFSTYSDRSSQLLKLLTVLCSAGFWARVNPSRILPRYDASLLLSKKEKKVVYGFIFPTFFNTGFTKKNTAQG